MARGLVSFIEAKNTASHEIRYRYRCEHCDKETEWITSSIRQTAKKIQKMGRIRQLKKGGNLLLTTLENMDKVEATSKKRIKQLAGKMKKALEAEDSGVMFPDQPFTAAMFNETFSFGKACPECGRSQSWYPAYSDSATPELAAKGTASNFGLLSGVAAMVAICLAYRHFWLALLCSAAAVGLFYGLGWVLGYTGHVRRAKKRERIKVDVRRRPEVDWNGI